MSKQVPVEDYLRWLEPQIRDDSPTQPPGEYWDLWQVMMAKPFVWHVPNDGNRVQDGLDLRAEFCYDRHIRPGSLNHLGPCSFLEVLIGLSRRLAFVAGGRAVSWAWQLLCNLQLHRMRDPLAPRKAARAEDIMDVVIWRNYLPSGEGGFFPLLHAREDQRDVELWYQMAAYVHEMQEY